MSKIEFIFDFSFKSIAANYLKIVLDVRQLKKKHRGEGVEP